MKYTGQKQHPVLKAFVAAAALFCVGVTALMPTAAMGEDPFMRSGRPLNEDPSSYQPPSVEQTAPGVVTRSRPIGPSSDEQGQMSPETQNAAAYQNEIRRRCGVYLSCIRAVDECAASHGETYGFDRCFRRKFHIQAEREAREEEAYRRDHRDHRDRHGYWPERGRTPRYWGVYDDYKWGGYSGGGQVIIIQPR